MNMSFRFAFLVVFLFFSVIAYPQQRRLALEEIEAIVEKDGCFEFQDAIKICKYDFKLDGQNVEAITIRPPGNGPIPGIMLIPGLDRRAIDLASIGRSLSKEGFACMAITQPGFGKSEEGRDYVGPNTIKTLMSGFKKFQREPFVDAKHLGIYGYSRGAMAASLMAVQLDDLKAVVLGGGIYDFQKAYDENRIEGIRDNMKKESGMTSKAIKERSSIVQMENLKCPVLIIHGEKDMNVPVTQAYLLRDRLTALKKDFEIKLYPDRDHSLSYAEIITPSVEFFKKRLLDAGK
jgi:dipeptidyl aminopeptidase/acylaminoacyl peptidase